MRRQWLEMKCIIREGEKEWRGPAEVVGVQGKTVIVKHGSSLREIARVHITRIQSKLTNNEGGLERNSVKDDRSKDDEESENEVTSCDMTGMIGRRDVEIREREEEEEDDGNEQEGDEGGEARAEEIPKLKKGNRIRAINKDTGQLEEWTVLSLAGKRSSTHWSDSYNVQDSATGDRGWINLRDYRNVEEIAEEEEVLLGFENKEVLEAKERELQSWRENSVYDEVEDLGQKAISTRWIVTEKFKGGEKICKARLVARGFEEEMAEWEKDAPTCNAELLKMCLTIIKLKKWNCYTLDVKTAYLQGDVIEREVYLKPPVEGDWSGLWKLRKTVYGLKDAAKAWYSKVVKVVKELGGRRSRLEPNVFYWRKEKKLVGQLNWVSVHTTE